MSVEKSREKEKVDGNLCQLEANMKEKTEKNGIKWNVSAYWKRVQQKRQRKSNKVEKTLPMRRKAKQENKENEGTDGNLCPHWSDNNK